ncbi:MAG TPA: hypothetical protein VGJ01_07325 [Pseudolabrys sp.]|jgi:hypothetical protein
MATVLNGPVRSCAAVTTTWSTGAAGAEEARDALVIGDVGRDAGDAELFGSGLQALGTARGDDDFGALRLRLFGDRKTDARRTTDDDNLLPGKRHAVSSFCVCAH